MKKSAAIISLITAIFIVIGITINFAFEEPGNRLVGQWSILNPDGTLSGESVFFKRDYTYTVTLGNGQIGENGNYLLKDSVFSIQNIKDVCGKGYWGKYYLRFIGADSVHLSLFEDSCSERKTDLVGYNPGLKRILIK